MFPELDKEGKPELLHGSTPRGLDGGAAAAGHGRFGRMFAGLPPCEPSDDAIAALLTTMDSDNALGLNPVIPAGYTYLGQFIDHDITFDPNSQLDKTSDPFALTNFRSPRLDLDSLYGSGPADQPYLYDWHKDEPDPGVKLFIAKRPGGAEGTIDDLPRNDQGRALIGDPRNDVHLVIAQLHLLFLKFHNNVVDHVRETQRLSGSELFREACRIVRWHYQWVVVHDFLPRVVGPTTTARVIKPEGAWPPVERRHFRWEHVPFIPVEFSGAAYRFGHSMVRDTYRIHRRGATAKAVEEPVKGKLFPEDPAAGTSATSHLTGFRELIPELEVEWKLFFEIDPGDPPQESMRIDTGLAIRMSSIPSTIAGDRSLPRMNLQRGRALGLPSGQDIARATGEREPLSPDELFPDGVLARVPEKLRTSLERSTPLWYYILAEAAAKRGGNRGRHLGSVGGVIVAEVLMGLLEADPQSYLSQAPGWTPELAGAPDGKFTMADLVNFASKPAGAPSERTPANRASERTAGRRKAPTEFEEGIVETL